MFLLGQSFPQISLISSHSEKPLLFFFYIQPEEGPGIRAETSYPIASFWVAGDERELWKKTLSRVRNSIDPMTHRTIWSRLKMWIFPCVWKTLVFLNARSLCICNCKYRASSSHSTSLWIMLNFHDTQNFFSMSHFSRFNSFFSLIFFFFFCICTALV